MLPHSLIVTHFSASLLCAALKIKSTPKIFVNGNGMVVS